MPCVLDFFDTLNSLEGRVYSYWKLSGLRHLSPGDEESITFLFEQIVKASAKLPKFYDPERGSDDAGGLALKLR